MLRRGGVVVIALATVVSIGMGGAFVSTGTGGTASAANVNAHGEHAPMQSAVQGPAYAQEAGGENQSGNRSAESVIRNAKQSYGDIEEFNATLVSTSQGSNGTGIFEATNTTAKLSVKRPDEVRLEIREPTAKAGSVIVSNSSTTTVYNATNNTVRSYEFPLYGTATGSGDGSGANRAAYLGGVADTLTRSNVSYEGTATVAGQEAYVLSVEPNTTMNATLGTATTNLTYYLGQESYVPVKIATESSVRYKQETVTYRSTTTLRDLQVNADVPDSVFEFTPPENVTRPEVRSPGITTYDSVANAKQNTDITFSAPSDIPEGYSFASAAVTSNGNTSVGLQYTNDSANPINNSFSVGISTRQPELRANQTHMRQNVTINGRSGTYFRAGEGIVMFSIDDLRYTVSGPFSKATLVSIAESIESTTAGENAANGTANATTPNGTATSATTYYQVDFVRGEPIENLDWPNGTYTNDQLIRFAHGSTDEAITRRSEGEFTTDEALAERIDSHDIEVENGTATVTFTVADGESVTLSLASYTKPDSTWDPEDEDDQVFADAQTETYESGTHTLTVDLPGQGATDGTDATDGADDGIDRTEDGGDGAGDGDNETTLTLLSYNDIQTAAARDQNSPRLVELIAERRQAHDNPTVVVGGGDEIAPHALGPLSQWRAPVDVLNLVEPAAEGVGNHDLDYGLSGFANASAASEFPWLVANLRNATTGEPIDGANSYEIVERDGVRVGFVGLVDPAIKNKTNLAFGENGSRLTDFSEVGPETATMLKEERNVDVVVALAHIGVPESKELARADDGAIDAIVTGDDEIYYPPQETSGTVITEAGATAEYLGELNLTVEDSEVTESNGRIINVTNATPKNETASGIITEYRAEASFDQTIAVSEVPLDARSPFPTAVRETAYGHLITDAMRNETGADVAIVQEGGIRSDQVYGPGNISGSDVFSTLPFGNTLVTLEVTGDELKAALASQIRSDRPEEGVAQQVSGISFEWTDSADTEENVQNVTVGGEPLNEDATYSLTVSNFVAEGGDGYPLADQPRINETDKLLATTVIEYMEALGTVSPSDEGRTEEIGSADDGSGENASAIKMPNGIRAVVT